MACRICIVQVQPRKHVPDHAGYAAPTQQHELQYIIQIRDPSALKDLDHELYWE